MLVLPRFADRRLGPGAAPSPALPRGPADAFLRAFAARTGTVWWRYKLPPPAHGTPSTYLGRDGKQYVVIGANGGSYIRSAGGDDVIAYTIR